MIAAEETSRPREQQILDLLVCGYENAAIAQELHIAEPTVKVHLKRLFRRHGVTHKSKRTELALKVYGAPSELQPTTVHLSDREMLICSLVADARSNEEIAQRLGTTEHVIKNYLREIYDRAGVWNRVELALWYVSHFNVEGTNETSSNRLHSH